MFERALASVIAASILAGCTSTQDAAPVRIPTKPATHSDQLSATCSDFIPAGLSI